MKSKFEKTSVNITHYSVMDIAAMLSVSRQTAQRLVEQEIGFINLGTGRRRIIRVSVEAYSKWLEGKSDRVFFTETKAG